MSGKKFDLKKLVQWKRKQSEVVNTYDSWNCNFPVDWLEFNKLFFSKRHVIVEYSQDNAYGALLLASFYAVLKMAKEKF